MQDLTSSIPVCLAEEEIRFVKITSEAAINQIRFVFATTVNDRHKVVNSELTTSISVCHPTIAAATIEMQTHVVVLWVRQGLIPQHPRTAVRFRSIEIREPQSLRQAPVADCRE